MFSKILKFTTILFVLMAFFVAPPSMLSDGNNGNGSSPAGSGWGSPVRDKVCKGSYDTGLVGECPQLASECTGSVEYKVKSESEGCVTKNYGFLCYEKTVTYGVGTAPCEITLIVDEFFCLPDVSGLTPQSSTDCKNSVATYKISSM